MFKYPLLGLHLKKKRPPECWQTLASAMVAIKYYLYFANFKYCYFTKSTVLHRNNLKLKQ